MTECQWIGEGEGCTNHAVKDRSYCEDHVWLVYQQGTAIRRRKDQRRANNVFELQDLFNQAVAELELEGYL